MAISKYFFNIHHSTGMLAEYNTFWPMVHEFCFEYSGRNNTDSDIFLSKHLEIVSSTAEQIILTAIFSLKTLGNLISWLNYV